MSVSVCLCVCVCVCVWVGGCVCVHLPSALDLFAEAPFLLFVCLFFGF